MKQHTEQHLDSLAKKLIKSAPLKSPSVDFTADIIKQIEHVPVGKTIAYKPLISKYAWFGIVAVLIGVSIYMMFGNVTDSTWLSTIDLSIISNNKITEVLSGFKISKTLMYAVGFFGLVFFIQIPLMKHFLNKQLDY